MIFYEKFIFPDLDIQEELVKETNANLNIYYLKFASDANIVEESLISSLSSFIKNIATFLMNALKRIWTSITNFVTMIIEKIKSFLDSKRNKKEIKLRNSIKLPLVININQDPIFKSYNTLDQVINDYKLGLASINKEIYLETKKFIKDIEEWKRINIDFDRNSSHILQEKVIYNDANLHTLEYPEDYNEEVGVPQYTKTGNLQDKSLIDAFQNDHMILDIDKLKDIYKLNKGLIKAYNIFKKESAHKIKEYMSSFDYQVLDSYYTSLGIPNIQDKYFSNYLERPEFEELIFTNAFPVFTGDIKEKRKQIRLWAGLLISKHDAIVRKLYQMLENNSKVLNIAKSQAEIIQKQITKNDFSDFSKLFTDTDPDNPNQMIIDRFIEHNRRIMDFSQLGLGKIIYSQELSAQITMLKDVKYCKRIFNYLTRYDVVIFAHGFSINITFSDWLKQLRESNIDEYNALIDIPSYKKYIKFLEYTLKKDITKITGQDESILLRSFGITINTLKERKIPLKRPDINGLRFRAICPEKNKLFKRWYIQKVLLPGSAKEFTDIEAICNYLLKNDKKCKRILLVTCNPGRIVLDYKLEHSKNILIISSTGLLSN